MKTKVIFLSFLCAIFIVPIHAHSQSENTDKALDPDSQEFQIAQNGLTKDFIPSPEVSLQVNRLQKEFPDQGSPTKYGRDGHQFATYIVAMAAKLCKERSHELAYFSQFPDDEKKFSGTLAFFYLFDLDYRKQIMAILHSLHGGDVDAVQKRRRDLQALISDGLRDKQLEDYQIGLIIHAFADSYAHTMGQGAELKAFNYAWGHLFHGNKPDLIDHDPEKFKEYTCSLYTALSSQQDCSLALKDLHKIIDHLAFSRNDALPLFEKYAEQNAQFDRKLYESFDKSWKNTVDKAAIKQTIELIESRIRDQEKAQ